MRIYIKGDYTKEIPFNYLELANKMWFENYQGEGIPLSPILVFFKSEIGMI